MSSGGLPRRHAKRISAHYVDSCYSFKKAGFDAIQLFEVLYCKILPNDMHPRCCDRDYSKVQEAECNRKQQAMRRSDRLCSQYCLPAHLGYSAGKIQPLAKKSNPKYGNRLAQATSLCTEFYV